MAKRERLDRQIPREYIEVQKGPISMEDQYTNNFRRQPESMMRDIEDNSLRHSSKTLTLHTPKR